MEKNEIAQLHKQDALKLYGQRTVAAISRRIERGEKDFRIGAREYHADEMGVHYYSNDEPFCIHYHELPIDEKYWTKHDYEMLNTALKNSQGNEEKQQKKPYMLKIIGESPLYYSSFNVAFDCQRRYLAAGKMAMVMKYDPETDDYLFVC